jgi:hypothetical protein
MPARRERPVDDMPPATFHFLVSGCWRGGLDLEAFLAAGNALRGDVDGLRRLWRVHGDAVKRRHRGETFAERALALKDAVPDFEYGAQHTFMTAGGNPWATTMR